MEFETIALVLICLSIGFMLGFMMSALAHSMSHQEEVRAAFDTGWHLRDSQLAGLLPPEDHPANPATRRTEP